MSMNAITLLLLALNDQLTKEAIIEENTRIYLAIFKRLQEEKARSEE